MEEGGRVRWRRNEVERKEDQEVEETRIGGGGGGSEEKRPWRKEEVEGGWRECLPPLNLLVLALNMIQMLSSLLFCPSSLPQSTSLEPGTTRPTILPFLSSPLLSLSFPSLILSSFDFIYIYPSSFFLPSIFTRQKEERKRERVSV